MSRPAAIPIVVIGLAALAATVLGYRARKLAILEPRQLDTALVWTGQAGAPCTLLMIGDSQVARWRTPPPPDWRIARLGFPGEAATNIADVASSAIREVAPDAVLLAAGTNDASAAALQWSGRDRTLDRAADAVARMIVSARTAGANPVIVMTLVPPRDPALWRRPIYGARQAATLTALSGRIAESARSSKAEVLDADALARDARGRFRPELRADALHWSPRGYELLSAALWHRLAGKCR